MEQTHNMSTQDELGSAITDSMKEEGQHVNNSTEERTTPKEVKAPVQEQPTTPEEPVRFAEKVDTKGLTPEQLEEIYEGYNKKYTQRRQKENEEIREYKRKLAEYEGKLKEQPAQQTQQFEAQDLAQAGQEARKQVQLGNMSLEDYTNHMRELFREDAKRIAEETYGTITKTEKHEQYSNSMLEGFNSLDDRFNNKYVNPESPEYNEVNKNLYEYTARQMSSLLDEYIAENGSAVGFDWKTPAESIIKQFDSLVDAQIAARARTQTASAQASASRFSKTAPKGTTNRSVSATPESLDDLLNKSMENLSR